MPHTMQVDDWMWEWAQDETGLTVPTSHLRAILASAIAQRMAWRRIEAHIPVDVAGRPEDSGRVIRLNYTTVCSACRERGNRTVVRQGDEAVIYRDARGRTQIDCLDHASQTNGSVA